MFTGLLILGDNSANDMRSPSDVIGVVILQNSFVFLALFLALVLKERRVRTSPVFTQNRLFKK